MRTGADYLAALRDGRTVIVDGVKVDDVTTDPAFADAAKSIAGLFDISADPASGMQFIAPETGRTANRAFGIPRTADDLAARRDAIQRWADASHGWLGRSPDHVGSFVAAFASHAEVFDTADATFSENVRAFHRRLLDEDLYLSYAIIPPQVSRATTASGWGEDFLQVGIVDETAEGIIVRGSQMLATGAAIADELFVSCIKPLAPGDEDFAISFVTPMNAPGLKLYNRRPYAPGVPSEFDYPLTSRFDEPDSLVVFDDVLIPWERVFVKRDRDAVRAQFFSTGAHVQGNWQAQIRLATKLRFIAGIAKKVTEINGVDKFPGVQEKLGELASLVTGVESAIDAAQFRAKPDGKGVWTPASGPLYGAMGLQAELYPRVIQIVRDLVGGGVLQLPASLADVEGELSGDDIERYVQSPGTPSRDRIKLFKLAWDVVGSEFGGRHQQYEMFYAGAPFVVKANYTYRAFPYADAVREVEGFLDTVGAEAVDAAVDAGGEH